MKTPNYKFLILYPELAAEALKNNEQDIFIIWSILKKLDTNGSGLVLQGDILKICDKVFGIQSTHAYSKITKGINKYWRKPKGSNGQKTIGLFSFKQIVERLSPKLSRCEPIIIPFSYFDSHGLKNSKHIKNLLIGCIAGRFVDHRPISLASIQENTGQSENTVRNAIKSCAFIETKMNLQKVSINANSLEVLKLKALQTNSVAFSVTEENGKYFLNKQIPNSYIIKDFDRLPLKSRPEILSKTVQKNFELLLSTRYHLNKQSSWKTTDAQNLIKLRTFRTTSE
jgi:hypothetical protein